MMTWIFTSAVIAVISAALLKLFDENVLPESSNEYSDEPAGDGGRFGWESMTESDLDALVREFCALDEGPAVRNRV